MLPKEGHVVCMTYSCCVGIAPSVVWIVTCTGVTGVEYVTATVFPGTVTAAGVADTAARDAVSCDGPVAPARGSAGVDGTAETINESEGEVLDCAAECATECATDCVGE